MLILRNELPQSLEDILKDVVRFGQQDPRREGNSHGTAECHPDNRGDNIRGGEDDHGCRSNVAVGGNEQLCQFPQG